MFGNVAKYLPTDESTSNGGNASGIDTNNYVMKIQRRCIIGTGTGPISGVAVFGAVTQLC